MKWLQDLRQMSYPPEFRIKEPVWEELISSLSRETNVRSTLAIVQITSKDTEILELQKNLILALATNLWRTRQKMLDPTSGEPEVPMKKAFRHVSAMWDALHENGIEIQDHTHQSFHLGQTLNAIAFEPKAGLTGEVVIETVKPTVYFRKEVIQVGDVIVGTPLDSSASSK